MQIPHLLPKLFGGLALLLSGLAQASALQISLVRSIHGGSCQDAIVRNLTSTTLQITLNYVIKGTDGSYYSGSAPIGGTTFNGGANTGYYMTGLGPGASTTVSVNNFAFVPCNVGQSVDISYTTYNVDAHNQRVSSNESGERRALGQMIDNWNNKEQQRKQEREAQRKAEMAKRWEEETRKRQQIEADRPCAQLGQYCDRRLIKSLPPPTVNYGTEEAHERAIADMRARQAEEQRQLDLDRQRIEAEMAKGQAAREAYNREAEARTARAQAEWKAQQAAAQQAAQAARERQQAATAARAAAEQRRQVQWQQQVDLTSSLLQGSVQNSESALAASHAKLGQIVTTYDKEDDALASILAKAAAAAKNKK